MPNFCAHCLFGSNIVKSCTGSCNQLKTNIFRHECWADSDSTNHKCCDRHFWLGKLFLHGGVSDLCLVCLLGILGVQQPWGTSQNFKGMSCQQLLWEILNGWYSSLGIFLNFADFWLFGQLIRRPMTAKISCTASRKSHKLRILPNLVYISGRAGLHESKYQHNKGKEAPHSSHFGDHQDKRILGISVWPPGLNVGQFHHVDIHSTILEQHTTLFIKNCKNSTVKLLLWDQWNLSLIIRIYVLQGDTYISTLPSLSIDPRVINDSDQVSGAKSTSMSEN